MNRARSRSFVITQVTADGARRTPDDVIVEEPMTIQLDGVVVSTTMRTPGHDFELAAGFLYTEGLLAGAPVTGVRYCGDRTAVETEFNVVNVETGGRAPTPKPRLGTTSSSCGWCGSEQLDDLCQRLSPVEPSEPFPLDVLARVPGIVQTEQKLFGSTGSVHAAAAFDHDEKVLIVREDVGRHNAVDKVVGAMLLAGNLPATGLGLFVSGRASIEIVQKAWAAGFGTVIAVSAPTALAVDAARRAEMWLTGFTRAERFNVYSPERLPDATR